MSSYCGLLRTTVFLSSPFPNPHPHAHPHLSAAFWPGVLEPVPPGQKAAEPGDWPDSRLQPEVFPLPGGLSAPFAQPGAGEGPGFWAGLRGEQDTKGLVSAPTSPSWPCPALGRGPPVTSMLTWGPDLALDPPAPPPCAPLRLSLGVTRKQSFACSLGSWRQLSAGTHPGPEHFSLPCSEKALMSN